MSTISSTSSGSPKRKGGLKRLLVIALGAIVILFIVGVLLVPTIASSIGPGIVQDAMGKQFKGTVKVNGLQLGWFSGAAVGPVEVRDDKGKLVASLNVKTPISLWQVVSQRMWSAKKINVGTIQLGGTLDIERDASGTSNLEKALEPKQPVASAPATSNSGGGIESLKAALQITNLDITVRELGLDGKPVSETGVKGLKGDANIDYAPGNIAAQANMTGNPVGAASPVTPMAVKFDVALKSVAGSTAMNLASLDKANIKAEISAAPVGVIDALAKMGGALAEGMGDKLDLKIDGSGNGKAGLWTLSMQSPGIQANFNLEMRDWVLSALTPSTGNTAATSASNHITVRSLAFLQKLPQTRAMMGKIGEQLKLTGPAPSLDMTIDQLRLPVPTTGGASVDAKNSGLTAHVRVGQMAGQVATDTSGPTPGDWRNFQIQPTDITINAADLTKPVTLTAGTRANVDGQSAGEVNITASAQGLLDKQGGLRAMQTGAGIADKLSADVKVTGLSTMLVQPVVAGMGVPITVQDVGPTLNASVQVRADTTSVAAAPAAAPSGASSSDALPPTDVVVNVTSQNINIAGALHAEKNELRTGPDGLTIHIASIAPLAQRMVNKPGSPPVATIGGVGVVAVTIRDLVMPIGGAKSASSPLASIRGSVDAQLQNLSVQTVPAAAAPGAPAPVAPAPVLIDNLTLNAMIAPGTPPSFKLTSGITQNGSPVNANADLTLQGFDAWLKNAQATGAGAGGKSGNMFDDLFKLAPSGTVTFLNVPRSLLVMAPGLGIYLADSSTDNVSKMIRGAVGQSASLNIAITPEPASKGGEGGTSAHVQLTTAAKGVGADLNAKLTQSQATVSTLSMFFNADPATMNPVLAEGSGGTGGMKIAQPFKVQVALVDPITVPLTSTGGTLQPDLSKAGDATIKLTADKEIALDNVPVGTDANNQPITTQIRLKNFTGQTKVPISGFASADANAKTPKASPKATFDLSGQVAQGSGARLVDISGQGSATLDASDVDATFKLANLDTAGADAMLHQNGYVTGALGEKADASVRITPKGSGTLAIVAELTSPRISGGTINLTKSPSAITLNQPTTITWKPDGSFLGMALFGNKPGGVSVTKTDPVSVQINKLAVASSNTDTTKGPITGPLKPGVFAIDATLSVPSITMNVPSADAKSPATPLTIGGLRAAVKQADGKAGEIDAELTMDSVTSGTSTAKKQGGHVSLANLADANGVIDTKHALINADATLTAFPTIIVDQLAQQKGVLNELLGPTLDVKVTATDVSQAATTVASGAAAGKPGHVDATLTSPRASLQVTGTVAGGVFTQSGTLGGKVTEIRPELLAALHGGVPLVASVSKTTSDQPATLDASSMQIPIDGDMRKLNGSAKIDPGVASFKINSVLGDLLTSTGNKADGVIGQKIQPFVVNFKDGVATYNSFVLPIGTFNIETSGTVDLVQRQINVVTYVPLMGLSDKALSFLNQGAISGKLGGLDKLTKVPITTKGSLDNPTTQVDVGIFFQNIGDTLIKQPGKALEGALDNIFGKKPAATPAPAPAPTPAPTPKPRR